MFSSRVMGFCCMTVTRLGKDKGKGVSMDCGYIGLRQLWTVSVRLCDYSRYVKVLIILLTYIIYTNNNKHFLF